MRTVGDQLKAKKEKEEEEDLNDANYDEVCCVMFIKSMSLLVLYRA